MTSFEFVADAAALAAHCARWQTRPWLAIDTEFLREDTYHPILCLVQVGDGERQVCIDALALDEAALAPLWRLLRDAAVTKVFHAASQDLEIFVRRAGGAVAPMFDTQIAAALLGIGDQLGYAALVEKRFGVVLDKSLTRMDWSRRPLPEAALAYAADDVSWLAKLYPMLREELAARERLAWCEEDCARLAEPARYVVEPAQAFRRLKGLPRLLPPSQRIAAGLADWRETEAQACDRPRKWILDDDALYRVAERRPQTLSQLGELGLPLKTVERHGAVLLERVAAPPDITALAEAAPLDGAQKALLKRLQDRLRDIGATLDIPATLIGPRAEVEALLRHGAAARSALLQGWRYEAAGAELLEMLPAA